jgi:hypothetical protein
MRREKNKEKIEEVIQVKIKDIEEARKRITQYIVPLIVIAFLILLIFYFSMMAVFNFR